MRLTFKYLISTLCFLRFADFLSGATWGPIDSPEALSEVLRKVEAGDSIVIADGKYERWLVDLDARGKAGSPITIRPESLLGVTFTGVNHFNITGSHIVVDGFLFDRCALEHNLLEFDASDHCRVENCVFQHSGGNRAVVGINAGARNNGIISCTFNDIAARSVNLHINEKIYEKGVPTGNVVRGNTFRDIPPANANGRETIKIGTNQPTFGHIQVGTIVEDNQFLRCDGEAEIISNKCAGNIYRRNIFEQCQGELVMRGGRDCLIESNRFVDCSGGIRICGTGHVVRDNVILNSRGTGIRLFFGMTKEQGGHYQAAGNCTITNNTIIDAGRAGLLIGDGRNRDWQEKGMQSVAPQANRVLNNIIVGSTGDLLLANHAPDNLIEGNLFHKQGDAKLTSPGRSFIDADPLFRDPEAGDYRLSKDSPALSSNLVKGASSDPVE